MTTIVLADAFTCMNSSFLNAAETFEPTFSGDKKTLELFPANTYSEKFWRLNNWRKLQKVEISFPDDKTPDGTPCIQMDFKSAEGGCNIIAPSAFAPGVWRSEQYDAISFWVKGDCGGKRAKIQVDVDSGAYSWVFSLDSEKWKKITLPISSAYTKTGNKTDLHSLKLLYFSSEEEMSFRIGSIALEKKINELPFSTAKSVIIPEIKDSQVALDANFDAPIWTNAAKMELVLVASSAEAKEKTEIRLFSDGSNLIVGARLFCADSSKLLANCTKQDEQVWQDDSLELLIDDSLDACGYRHIIVNSVGAVQDYHKRFDMALVSYTVDKEWNSDVKVVNKLSATEWLLQMSIPLVSLGLSPGKPFGLQIGRENHLLKEYSVLSPARKFCDPPFFATALIGKANSSPVELSLQMEKPGEMILHGKLDNASVGELSIDIADPYAKTRNEVVKITCDSGGQFIAPFSIPAPSEGLYRIVVSGTANGALLAPIALIFPMVLAPEISFGDIYLNPKPKEMKTVEGFFTFDKATPILIPENSSERTRETARFLRTELHLNLFNMLPSITTKTNAEKWFSMSLVKDFKTEDETLRAELAKLPVEGYFLEVSPDGVTILGADEAGLYYGAVTLIHLMRANCIKKHEPRLGCVRIKDWPDLPIRIVTMWAGSRYNNKETGHRLDVLKDYLKEVVAGNKQNHFSLLLDFGFEYDKESIIALPWHSLSREDYEELVRFARKHFIEFVPALQSGGHSQHFTTAYPELREPGYKDGQVNVLNEKWRDILESCYDDILSATPGAKYFFIWHDEWWAHAIDKKTDTFMGKERWEIFRDEILKNHNYFKTRGITMMMWCDMLLKDHNGGYPFNVSKGLEAVPKDIIMMNWSASFAPNSTLEMQEKGFTVCPVLNCFNLIPHRDNSSIKGFGCIAYARYLQTYWHVENDTMSANYIHAPLRAAEFAWNASRECQLPLGEWRRRYLNSILSTLYFPKRRAEKLSFQPIDLMKYVNANAAELFDDPKNAPLIANAVTDIGFIPMQMINQGGMNILVPDAKTNEVSVEINSTAKSLIFLEAVYIPKDKKAEIKKRGADYLRGIPVAELRVEYNDGASEIIPLLLGINTNEITPQVGCCFMFGSRFAHNLKTVGGGNANLYALEWANPYQGRSIRKIVLKNYGMEAIPIIFAITTTH